MTSSLMTMASIEVIFTVFPITKKFTKSFETAILVTNTYLSLKYVLYIYYPFCFQKDKKGNINALIDFDNKVNAMILAYIKKLGLRI